MAAYGIGGDGGLYSGTAELRSATVEIDFAVVDGHVDSPIDAGIWCSATAEEASDEGVVHLCRHVHCGGAEALHIGPEEFVNLAPCAPEVDVVARHLTVGAGIARHEALLYFAARHVDGHKCDFIVLRVRVTVVAWVELLDICVAPQLVVAHLVAVSSIEGTYHLREITAVDDATV